MPPPHHHRPRAPPCTGYVHYPNHRPPPLPILLLFLLHCWISMQQIHSDVGQGRDQRGGNVHLFVWVQMSLDFCACQRLYLASMVAASINLCLIWPPPTASKRHRSPLLSLVIIHTLVQKVAIVLDGIGLVLVSQPGLQNPGLKGMVLQGLQRLKNNWQSSPTM